jgi:hypothetical protein
MERGIFEHNGRFWFIELIELTKLISRAAVFRCPSGTKTPVRTHHFQSICPTGNRFCLS